jgi:hypothetical protein
VNEWKCEVNVKLQARVSIVRLVLKEITALEKFITTLRRAVSEGFSWIIRLLTHDDSNAELAQESLLLLLSTEY